MTVERHVCLPSSEKMARSGWFSALMLFTLVCFWTPLSTLIQFSFQHEHYSHVILVPMIVSALVLLDRKGIFVQTETNWWAGSGLICVGGLFYVFAQRQFILASQNDRLSAPIFAIVVVWVGVFILCYGIRAFRRSLFPFLFLFLMIPIPDFLLERIIAWLLAGSAEVSDAFLELLGVPFFRTGFVFSFPQFTIEIAQECSGIRSSLALLVMSLLAGHLFLRSAWTRAALVAVTVPILVIKNGIRIVTLALLSMYVDPRFLTGSLHQQGGFVFFLIAMTLLLPILWLLQRVEAKRRVTAASGAEG